MMRLLYVVLIALSLAEIGDAITGWTGPVNSKQAGATGSIAAVPENTQGSWSITFQAESDHEPISYALLSQDPIDVFKIVSSSGVMTVADHKVLDFEAHESHSVVVVATDAADVTVTGTATVTIPISDVNDAPVFAQSLYTVNIPDGSTAGTSVITVTATDEDASPNNEIKSYSFSGESNTNDDFAVAVNGAITVAKELSAERTANYALVVEAVDGGDLKGSTTVNVCVGCDNGKGVMCASLLLVLASALLGIQQNARFV